MSSIERNQYYSPLTFGRYPGIAPLKQNEIEAYNVLRNAIKAFLSSAGSLVPNSWPVMGRRGALYAGRAVVAIRRLRVKVDCNVTAPTGSHAGAWPYLVAAPLCYPTQIPGQIPEPCLRRHMHTFTSFDGTRIAYSDEGDGPTVILLHGFGVDALGQFGEFERILPGLEKRQAMFRQAFGAAPPLPDPPPEGRPGLARALLAAGARIMLPDMRGFGASGKPREKSAYENSALSRDIVALIDHLDLDAVDVIGFSMGCGTTARLLALHPPQVKSAILAGVGDYALEDHVVEFPKNWPIPDSVPRPITKSVWAEEGARILEQGEIVPGHLASASLMAARAAGADPKVYAAVIRGAVMPPWPAEALRSIEVPVLILNGRADAANQKIDGLLRAIPTARAGSCEGDHNSTPYQPTFHQAVIRFFQEQWRLRR